MAFGTNKRRNGFADGGTVDVTITPGASSSFIGANSSIPALTAAQIAKYPTLPAAAPLAQPAFQPQPFGNAMANVPVGGTSGTPNSPYMASIGANGVPAGSPPPPVTVPTHSSLTPAPAAVVPTAARGGPAHFALGGAPSSNEMMPFYARAEEHGMNMQPPGLVKSMGAGRTDIHPINVPSGAYVLPADVVSGLGEGNTLSGSSVIDKMMNSMPYGIQERKMGRGPGTPRAPAPPKTELHAYGQVEGEPGVALKARGGKADKQHGQPVPIVVAGGEHILYPQQIIQKFGSLQKGHAVLDKFVIGARKQTINDMRKLKGPKK